MRVCVCQCKRNVEVKKERESAKGREKEGNDETEGERHTQKQIIRKHVMQDDTKNEKKKVNERDRNYSHNCNSCCILSSDATAAGSPIAWYLKSLVGMLETVNALHDIPVQLNRKKEVGRVCQT